PSKFGAPRVFLAAVGPMMTEVAADVADGIMVHPMTSVKYLKQMTLPIVEASLKKRSRARNSFELSYPVFVVSGESEKEFAESKQAVKQRIAFYASTPAYRGVLETHGWGKLQPQLNMMSKQGKWVEMGELIEDEMLDAFAVVGEPQDIVPMIKSRYTGLVDRISINFSYAALDKRPALIRELSA
ncbi:MAG: LLM class flavin-dependent oxidoreductase, partial [Acidimicrobiales bacterium]